MSKVEFAVGAEFAEYSMRFSLESVLIIFQPFLWFWADLALVIKCKIYIICACRMSTENTAYKRYAQLKTLRNKAKSASLTFAKILRPS